MFIIDCCDFDKKFLLSHLLANAHDFVALSRSIMNGVIPIAIIVDLVPSGCQAADALRNQSFNITWLLAGSIVSVAAADSRQITCERACL